MTDQITTIDPSTGEVLAVPSVPSAIIVPRSSTAMMPLDLERELPAMFTLARALIKSNGFIPTSLAKAGEGGIVAAVLTGRELGIGPMAAIRSIHVIEGKATLSAELLLALAIRAGVRATWMQTTADCAVLRLERNGIEYIHTFTMADARAAGVAGKDVWRRYPDAMLRARCSAAAVRAFCPDVATGMYATEELEVPSTAVTAMVPEETLTRADEQARERGHENAKAEAEAHKTAAVAKVTPWIAALDDLGKCAKEARLVLNDASAPAESIAEAEANINGVISALDDWIEAHRAEYHDLRGTREGAKEAEKARSRVSKIAALVGRAQPDVWTKYELGES